MNYCCRKEATKSCLSNNRDPVEYDWVKNGPEILILAESLFAPPSPFKKKYLGKFVLVTDMIEWHVEGWQIQVKNSKVLG